MAITSVQLDDYMKRRGSLKGYTTTGSAAQVSSPTVSPSELRELMTVADATRHTVELVAGVLTLKPR
jgi:hypothetical protein